MICSGLQLANFCQDVARDWDRGRIYLPQADCRRFGCEEADFAQRRDDETFRCFAHEVAQAKALLDGGSAPVATMPRPWRLPVALFAAGGLATLEAIRRQDYDVWTRRPTGPRPPRKTPLDVRLLVEVAFRRAMICGKIGAGWQLLHPTHFRNQNHAAGSLT